MNGTGREIRIIDAFAQVCENDVKIGNLSVVSCILLCAMTAALQQWVGMSILIVASIASLIWRISIPQVYLRASRLVANTSPVRKRMELRREFDIAAEGKVATLLDEAAGTLQVCVWCADAGFPYYASDVVDVYQATDDQRFCVLRHQNGGWLIAKLSSPKPFDPLMTICTSLAIEGWESVKAEAASRGLSKETILLECKKRGIINRFEQ